MSINTECDGPTLYRLLEQRRCRAGFSQPCQLLGHQGMGDPIVTLHLQSLDFYELHPAVKRIALGLTNESANALIGLWQNIRRVIALRRILRQISPDIALGMMTTANVLLALAAWRPRRGREPRGRGREHLRQGPPAAGGRSPRRRHGHRGAGLRRRRPVGHVPAADVGRERARRGGAGDAGEGPHRASHRVPRGAEGGRGRGEAGGGVDRPLVPQDALRRVPGGEERPSRAHRGEGGRGRRPGHEGRLQGGRGARRRARGGGGREPGGGRRRLGPERLAGGADRQGGGPRPTWRPGSPAPSSTWPA